MPTILIADDSRVQLQLLSGWLQAQAFEVVTASDALQAWVSAARIKPDAVILDISMPAGSGIEVLKKLKMSVKTQSIPIIVVSGSGGLEMRDFVRRLGAVDFLQKPLAEENLIQILNQALSSSTPRKG